MGERGKLMFPLNVIAGAGQLVELQGAAVLDITLDPAPAQAQYRLTSAGLEQKKEGTGGSWVTLGTWLKGGSASDYDARIVSSGDATTPEALGTWVNLGSTREWGYLTDAVENLQTGASTVEIRRASTGPTLASASVSIRAEQAS